LSSRLAASLHLRLFRRTAQLLIAGVGHERVAI
jgi:hypothetical protein